MNNESPTITCSATEATWLASLLGANVLLGLHDPFVGWLTEEIETAWVDARQSLAARNYIALEANGQITLDTTVAALIGTWAKPDASFILTFTPIGKPTESRYFHLTRYLAVEQTIAAERYQLTALADARAVYQRILDLLQVENQVAAGAANITLLQAQLMNARASAEQTGAEGVLNILREAPSDARDALAQTLTQPRANGALVALAQRATAWEVAGLGLLEGANGLWRLRACKRDDENWVEAIPCDATSA